MGLKLTAVIRMFMMSGNAKAAVELIGKELHTL